MKELKEIKMNQKLEQMEELAYQRAHLSLKVELMKEVSNYLDRAYNRYHNKTNDIIIGYTQEDKANLEEIEQIFARTNGLYELMYSIEQKHLIESIRRESVKRKPINLLEEIRRNSSKKKISIVDIIKKERAKLRNST